ncbi:MAG: hypothetical protein E7630_01095 [Ruminococcaceae bacterium]|nr:hypothetical protein [Oscillospiraceae bacterium]
MEINKETVDKLKNLSPDQLRYAIGEIADALGASQSQKRMAQNHAALIRRKFAAMSESELQNQLKGITPEKQKELLSKLKL